jgi:hypothetical protein
MKTTSNGRWPPMKDNLKILKVEYLTNHWSDLPQIIDLSSGDQIKLKILEMKTTSNGRWPQNIKSWISQQPLIRSSSNLELSSGDQIQIKNAWNKDDL